MTYLASICATISLFSCCEKRKGKKPKSHWDCYRFPAIRHTIPSCQLRGCNKRWRELWRMRAREGGKGERGGCGGSPLINEKKCIVPVSWADENRQDKVQGRLLGTPLQRAAMHKMHISGEKNGGKQVGMANRYISDHVLNTVFICGSVSRYSSSPGISVWAQKKEMV